MKELSQLFPHNIITLDLSRCNEMTSHCWPYLQSFCHLRSLFPPPMIIDGDLAFISHFLLASLQELRLVGTIGLTSRCLRTLQRYGSRLETLELSNVDIFVDERTNTTAFPDLALQKFTRLESLTLQPLQPFPFIPGPLQDQETILSLSNTLTRLVVSGLDFSVYSVNDCLQHLSSLTKLQDLTLRATLDEEITTVLKVFEQLTGMRSLRDIDVQSLSEEEISNDEDGQALLLCSRYLPKLRSFGPRVTLSSQSSLNALTCSPIMSSLQALNISFSTTHLETEQIDRFLQSLLSIEKLAISDPELRAQSVATICSLPVLRFLSFQSCHLHTLSSVDYTSAFSRATGLVALEMLYCEQQTHLTDTVLEQALSSLTRLQQLSILCDTIPLRSIRLPSLPMLRNVMISSDHLKEHLLDRVSSLHTHTLSVGSKQAQRLHSHTHSTATFNKPPLKRGKTGTAFYM